jgi:hypothetical protein
MTVRYSLTRLEVVRTYLFAISSSPRISLVVLIICGWPGLVHLATKLSIAHSLVASDVFIVLLWAVCMFFLLLGWVFFRAKTNERILTISDQGIYTEIGKIRADYPWRKVKEIRDVQKYILLVNRSGNAFFIPNRAFENTLQRSQFLSDAIRWCLVDKSL